MKIVLTLLLLVHGLIHIIGFISAFQLAKIDQLSQHIPKPIGVLWLLTTLLFVIAVLAYSFGKEFWPMVAIVGVLFSQLLVILFWKDAKFGTVANIIILLVSLPAYGHSRFRAMVKTEVAELFEESIPDNPQPSTQRNIEDLPPIVQKWINRSGIRGTTKTTSVRLKQVGQMKTKPDGDWMSFAAEQYVNTTDPSFIWITKVQAMPLIYMDGRDKFKNGQGEMLITLLSLYKVVDEGNNDKIDSGSMQRYLAEICWFPNAALEDYMTWESLGQNSARATITFAGKKASGVFSFSDDGDFVSFETKRYFGGDDDAKLETWFIEGIDYRVYDGIKIPSRCKVTWKLEKGDFQWLNLEITDLEYDRDDLW